MSAVPSFPEAGQADKKASVMLYFCRLKPQIQAHLSLISTPLSAYIHIHMHTPQNTKQTDKTRPVFSLQKAPLDNQLVKCTWGLIEGEPLSKVLSLMSSNIKGRKNKEGQIMFLCSWCQEQCLGDFALSFVGSTLSLGTLARTVQYLESEQSLFSILQRLLVDVIKTYLSSKYSS